MKIKFVVVLLLSIMLCACDVINPHNNIEEAEKHMDVCLENEISSVGCRDMFYKYNCYVSCYPNDNKLCDCVELYEKIRKDDETAKDILIYCNRPVIRWGA